MKVLLIASAALCTVSTAAIAQDSEDFRVRVGLGAQLQPEFIGADDSEIAPLWDLDIARGTNEFSFEAPDDGFSIPIIETGGFSFGPAANLAPKRSNKDVGAAVGKVPMTFEAGAFAEFMATESIRLRLDGRRGLGGHDGFVGSLGADHIWREGDQYVFSIGPRVRFSDARYQRAYFGVTPAATIATGLPTYRPDGGVHAIGATTGASYQLNDRWGLFGFGGYDRLVGDAGKSPIVRQLGSRNQFSVGAGVSYTFTIAR